MYNLGINTETFNQGCFIYLKNLMINNLQKYHCHDFISIIYILSGTCTYNINGTHYHLKKGDLIVCNPNVYHCRIMSSGQEVIELHVGITNVFLENLLPNTLVPHDSNPVFKIVKYEQDFLRCYSEIITEQEKDEPGCEPLLKALVMKFIILFLRETNPEPVRVSTKDPGFNIETYDKVNIVNTIVTYINENYMNEISLDKISRNMYLSPVYISKIFKEEIGGIPD